MTSFETSLFFSSTQSMFTRVWPLTFAFSEEAIGLAKKKKLKRMISTPQFSPQSKNESNISQRKMNPRNFFHYTYFQKVIGNKWVSKECTKETFYSKFYLRIWKMFTELRNNVHDSSYGQNWVFRLSYALSYLL